MKEFFNSHSIVSIVSGVLAVFLAFVYLSLSSAADNQRLAKEISSLRNPISVVAAARDIGRGTRLTEKDLQIVKVPKAYVKAGFTKNKDQVIGKEVLAEIYGGEVIIPKRISGDQSTRASLGIRRGRVAVAVGIDEISGVAGGIRPGDRVDIFITDEEDERTSLIYKNIVVIGIGGVYPYSLTDHSEDDQDSVDRYSGGSMNVVLELTRGTARKLTESSENGKLKLALRAAETSEIF